MTAKYQSPPNNARLSETLRTGSVRGKDGSIRVPFKEKSTNELEWRSGSDKVGQARSGRIRRLENGKLALIEEAPIDDEKIRVNQTGLKKGYNPYESGCLVGRAASPKRVDLRQLGNWLKTRKRGPRK